jgi:hypothetical protein
MIATTSTISTTRAKVISAAVNETRTFTVQAIGNDCYVGGSDVTTANGFKFLNNAVITLVVPPNEELWAVVATGTHTFYTLTSFAEIIA